MSTIQQIYGDLYEPTEIGINLDKARENRERIAEARKHELDPRARERDSNGHFSGSVRLERSGKFGYNHSVK